MEEITRAAGVAKGTFYTYFASKSDIIVEEFWKIDRFYGEYAGRNLKRFTSPEEKLLAFTRAQLRYVQQKVGNDTLKILYANQILTSGQEKVIVKPEREWYRIISSVIRLGQESKDFRNDVAAEELARRFNSSMRSVFLDWCIADGGFDLQTEGLRYCREWLLPALKRS